MRFAGPLLAAPPPKGRLRAEIERLSQRDWKHPTRGGPVRFSASTIERWYYRALAAPQDPVSTLQRRVRSDPFGTHNVEANASSVVRRLGRETGLDLVALELWLIQVAE